MFLHNPVWNVSLFFACLFLFKIFILVDKTANEDVKLLAKHSNLWIRLGLWVCFFGAVIYMTLSDFSMIDGRYYVVCLHILFAIIYLIGIYGNFVGFKYGPKNDEYRKKNLFQLKAIIVLTALMLFVYFF